MHETSVIKKEENAPMRKTSVTMEINISTILLNNRFYILIINLKILSWF